MDQFFYSNQVYDKTIVLEKDEALHALRVLRKKIGDIIKIVDGKGNLYNASIEKDKIDDCKLKILSTYENYKNTKHYIHIAIAPTKSHDKLEFFVEKAVEIGVNEISFILTENSERNNVKLNRIKKRVIMAMKQSLKAYIPTINNIVPIIDFMKNCENNVKYIAHLNNEKNNHLIDLISKDDNYCILIGPEGDFSESEIIHSLNYGYRVASLGNSRLRTETAGIAACHILNLVNE
tara:strand:- start:430 stop:1134 length:705 start_codon:yes stop_codon:yes gene_type:complete